MTPHVVPDVLFSVSHVRPKSFQFVREARISSTTIFWDDLECSELLLPTTTQTGETIGEAEQQHTFMTAAHREGTIDSKDHEELKGIKSIANIKTSKKEKHLITHMRNEVKVIDASRKGIPNTFATFYKDLPTTEDLRTIATMLTMMKGADEETTKIVHEVFNLIITFFHNSQFMEKGYDHGDLQEKVVPTKPEIIPTNLFSPPPQCISHFSTMTSTDFTPNSEAINSLTRLGSKKNPDDGSSYDVPKKAEHGELTCGWRRSTSRRRSIQYSATVLTDVESYEFRIARGTKQGDPSERSSFQLGSPISNGEKTLRFGARRAWASHWDMRKETAYPSCDLLTTCS